MPPPETPYLREPGYAERYRDRRFTSGTGAATHRREVDAIRALLRRADAHPGPWLDLPSGAGRLSALLPGPTIRVDRDPAMLRAARADAGPRARAAALRLPFHDHAFAGALCMRLLHHLPSADERIAVLGELRRVTDGPLLVSFFHAASLQHLRRLLRPLRGRGRSRRTAIGAGRFCTELRHAGWEPVRLRPLARFVSEQWLVLARPTAPPMDRRRA